MRRLILLIALAVGWTAADAAEEPSPANDEAKCANVLRLVGRPQYRDDRETDQAIEPVCRDAYAVSFNNDRRTPDWVVETLTPEYFSGTWSRKEAKPSWKTDTSVKSSAKDADYRNKDFDRGHMAPAADMKKTIPIYEDTFYFTNAVPQVGKGFNRTIWQDLEGVVRDWVCDRQELVVITGPIYRKKKPATMKDTAVAIPDAVFKIAYDPRLERAIAFVMDNKAYEERAVGSDPGSVLQKYIVSVRDVETQTDLNFFTKFSRQMQDRIERHKSAFWGVKVGCGPDVGE